MVGKIYAGIIIDRVNIVNGSLTDDEHGSFKTGRGCVDQIFTLKQIGKKPRKKKCKVYVGFIDLEKAFDRVNRAALWQVLRMLSGIKSVYVDSLVCLRVKGGESGRFRIDSGVR